MLSFQRELFFAVEDWDWKRMMMVMMGRRMRRKWLGLFDEVLSEDVEEGWIGFWKI